MNTHRWASWRQLSFNLASLIALMVLGQACDGDGLKETKSGAISIEPPSIIFPAVISDREEVLIELIHAGERPVRITAIYLGLPDGDGGYTPIEGCDQISAGVTVDPIIAPELATCTLILTERPTLPAQLDNNSTEQVKVVYRPLLEGVDPSTVKLVIESNAVGMYQEVLDISVVVSTPELITERVIEFAGSGESTEYHRVTNRSTSRLIIDNVRIERNLEGSPAPINPADDSPVDEFVILPDECGIFDGSCYVSFERETITIPVAYRPFDEVGPDKATMFIEAKTEAGERITPIEVLLTTEKVEKNLRITPNPMIFNPAQNQEGRLEVSFVNGGLSSLSVFEVRFEPEGGPFTFRGAQNSFSIQGGGAYDLTAFWMPSDVREGTMVVETDADNAENGVIRVPITVGTGMAVSLLTADKSTLNFNGVAENESLEQSVTLTSDGADPVSISEIRIEGVSEIDNEVFELVSGADLTSLATGESATVTVRFSRPDAPAGQRPLTYAGTLIIDNDSLGGVISVNLTADPVP